jgi:hypothetical protein
MLIGSSPEVGTRKGCPYENLPLDRDTPCGYPN